MSYTNETTHYGIPLPLGTDKTTPMDYNESMQEIDTVLFGAKTDSDSALRKAQQVEEGLSQTDETVSGIAGRVTTLEGTSVTHGNAIQQNAQDIADVRADALDMIEAKDEGTAQVASVAVNTGEFFRYNDVLYIATSDIAINDTIVPNENCRATNVGTELTQINSALTTGIISTATDFNTLTSKAKYSISVAGCPNSPTPSSGGQLFVDNNNDGMIRQFFVNDSGETFVRYCQSGTWHGWSKNLYEEVTTRNGGGSYVNVNPDSLLTGYTSILISNKQISVHIAGSTSKTGTDWFVQMKEDYTPHLREYFPCYIGTTLTRGYITTDGYIKIENLVAGDIVSATVVFNIE